MLRMILGGSAALAIGLISGWTALALLPGKMTSAPEQAGTVNPDLRGPAPPPAAAERPARAQCYRFRSAWRLDGSYRPRCY